MRKYRFVSRDINAFVFLKECEYGMNERPGADGVPDALGRLISKKGEGTFSEVLKSQSIKNGRYFAIKCMKAHFRSIEQVSLSSSRGAAGRDAATVCSEVHGEVKEERREKSFDFLYGGLYPLGSRSRAEDRAGKGTAPGLSVRSFASPCSGCPAMPFRLPYYDPRLSEYVPCFLPRVASGSPSRR